MAVSPMPADPTPEEREALAWLLEREFGLFLANSPYNPGRFYGIAADAVIAAGWRRVPEGGSDD